MKNYYLILVLLLLTGCISKHQVSQQKSDEIKKYEYKSIDSFKGDTLAFIMYNFIDNKSQYINKPASVLFSKLPYEIKSYLPHVVYGEFKTFSVSYLSDSQYTFKVTEKLKMVDISITLKEAVPWHKMLELGLAFGDWTPKHSVFFGNLIVEDIAYFAYK